MKFGKLFLVTLFVSVWQTAWADTDRTDGLQKKVFLDSLAFSPDSIFLLPEGFQAFSELIPNEPDEVIQDRLSCIKSEIPLTFNPYVRGYVDYFTIRNRKYTRRMLERENLYFPLFEKYLKQHNMPVELKYLAVVESALNPKAKSHVGALGLWQFMPATGGDFKLVQNHFYDERMDPEKSTEAACKFLRQLHRMFGDWELALAAYNCGPGNVRKAIKRSGGKNTFWEIFPYLPKETRGYVPSFTAVMYAMNYADAHRISSDSLQYAIATDTVLVNHGLDLAKFSAELNMDPEELKNLNPALKLDYIPETVQNFAIKVPAEKRPVIAQNRSTILENARYFKPQPVKPEPVMIAKAEPVKPADTAAKKLQQAPYVVKAGDNLGKIASQYNVSIADLKTWNNLNSNLVKVDQKLIVLQPVPTHADSAQTQVALASSETKTPEETVAETKEKPVVLAKNSSPAKKATLAKPVKQTPKIIHSVQPGDTLWNISRMYDGITVEEIKKKNNLKSNELKPGQKLVISQSS